MTPKYTPEELRELMELAAKAVGKKVIRWADDGNGLLLEGMQKPWNPAGDDGDGARLESDLGMNVYWGADNVTVIGARACSKFYSDHSGDKQFTRRMASLSAAAEIGRLIP